MRRLVDLLGILFFAIPALALAQVPTYTLVDLGAANVPNGTAWPDADCHAVAQGTDPQGHTVYYCNNWLMDSSATANHTNVSVGYALVAANQPEPIENWDACCGVPPPQVGFHDLPVPPALQAFPAEAISVSEGGQYVVGFAVQPNTNGGPASAETRNAILWNNLAASELPALAGSGIQYDAAAYSADEWGEAVGESLIPLNAGGTAERATLWISGSAHELQYMLSPYVPVILTTARWIDCAGNIGAQGWPISEGNFPDTSNYPHNYLLLRQGAARNCTY